MCRAFRAAGLAMAAYSFATGPNSMQNGFTASGTGSAHRGRREEPGAVVPTAKIVCPAEVGIKGVLGRHVDMGPPEVAGYRRR